jgi:pilus assembly protein Flp/PilA
MKENRVLLYLMVLLNQLKKDAFRFKKDEDGAALIEYTVLLGILLVAVIAIIGLVGTWINGQWHALQTHLT